MKITLCGSTRFKDEYIKASLELTKKGHLVYSVGAFGHSGDTLTNDEKELVDLVHLQKILNSDAVLVVGKDENGQPYIGNSTRREIAWARLLHKKIFYECYTGYPNHEQTMRKIK